MGWKFSKEYERELLAKAGIPSGPADGDWDKPPVNGIKPSTKILPVVWKAYGIPLPVAEYRFFENRRWKCDYAWPSMNVGLEIEGGVWLKGRHNRGKGFMQDIEKYNTFAILGFRLLRCTPEQVKDGSIFKTVRQALRLEAFP